MKNVNKVEVKKVGKDTRFINIDNRCLTTFNENDLIAKAEIS